jgi:hypothetical protein
MLTSEEQQRVLRGLPLLRPQTPDDVLEAWKSTVMDEFAFLMLRAR